MALDEGKLGSQARACEEILHNVLWHCLAQGQPADRAVAERLRGCRRYGSRDRRLFRDGLFGVLRWWGWLRNLAPPTFRAAIAAVDRDGPPPLRPGAWDAALLAAAVLELAPLPPVAAVWARRLEVALDRAPASDGADSRAQDAARVFAWLGHEPVSPPGSEALLPAWAVPEIVEAWPLDRLVTWLQRRVPLWLRVQGVPRSTAIAALAEAGVRTEPHPALDAALRVVTPRLNLGGLAPYRNGWVEVQDLASQCIGLSLGVRPGQHWWDACAGAGGKTLQIAALLRGKGAILATDVRARTLAELQRRVRRAGVGIVRCRSWDGERAAAPESRFDGVLLDAPCSGSGTWRRNPGARWRGSAATIARCRARQLQLLRNAAAAVRRGGVLVYATCSLFRRENAAVAEAFLAEVPAFAAERFANPLTGALTSGALQIRPWDGDCDAMFVARFRRRS